ncbi:hypothetical protein D3C81_1704950 [compost metagenome]
MPAANMPSANHAMKRMRCPWLRAAPRRNSWPTKVPASTLAAVEPSTCGTLTKVLMPAGRKSRLPAAPPMYSASSRANMPISATPLPRHARYSKLHSK